MTHASVQVAVTLKGLKMAKYLLSARRRPYPDVRFVAGDRPSIFTRSSDMGIMNAPGPFERARSPTERISARRRATRFDARGVVQVGGRHARSPAFG
mmetsp:Transcript_5775/g.24076  ORF Transcript_5775/g.24076 Transcript_5775/m.24076 type:complete len:97 (-) Transcript_5775:356-646(-)